MLYILQIITNGCTYRDSDLLTVLSKDNIP